MRPLRILLAGHFRPNMHYGIMQKLHHGFIRLGHTVLHFDDRLIARGSTPFLSRQFGLPAMNAAFIRYCREYKPEVILLGHTEMLLNATLAAVRLFLPDVRIAYRNVDPLFQEQNLLDIKNRLSSVDTVFITTAGDALHPLGGHRAKVYFMPNPVDASMETGQAFAYTNQNTDVFYAIGGIMKNDPRPPFLEALQHTCPHVRFRLPGMKQGYIGGAAYLEALVDAKMGLSLSRRSDNYLYSSDRMAQYMGNGLLTFVDRATGFADLFTEEEIGFYSSLEELGEKIRFYAGHDAARQEMAKAGWHTIHNRFSSDRVAQYILERTLDQSLSLGYDWPTAAA
ncbi:MAG: glycosyltransferase [Holosporales bacterium]|jgi:hypothetical protein